MDTPEVRRVRNTLFGLGVLLALEYLLISAIPAYVYDKARVTFDFAVAMSTATPLVFRFYPVASEPQALGFFLALSPFFLIAKVVLVTRWLGSDIVGIYRYWVISPTATSARTIGLSLAILLLALLVGIFWPYYVFGLDHVREFEQTYGTADFREQWMLQGGWRLWLSWSVWQMGLSALFLAVGYCVLRENVREHGMFEARAAVFRQLPFAVFAGLLACVGTYMLLRLPTYQTVSSRPGEISAWLLQTQAALCGGIAGLCVGHLFGRSRAPRWSYALAAPLAIALTTFLLACMFIWSYAGAKFVSDLGAFMGVILVWLSWCAMFTVGALRDPIVALLDVLAIAGAVLLIRRSAPGKTRRGERGAGQVRS